MADETVRSLLGWVDLVADGAAEGDGVTNDSAALQRAVDRAAAYQPGGTVFVASRSGGSTYLLGTNVTIPSNVTLKISGGARFYVATGVTLTLNGPLESSIPKASIFVTFGTGTVTYGAGVLTFETQQTSIFATLLASAGASLIGFIQAAAGAVLRTLQAWMRERPRSVKDYGAVGDGSHDDTAAFTACVASFPSTGGVMLVPEGTFKLTSKVTLKSGMTVRGMGRLVSIINQYANDDAFYAVDPTGFHITIEDLQIYDGLGIGSRTAGHGIHGDGVANYTQWFISRVYVLGFNDGINLASAAYMTLRDVRIVSAKRDGLSITTNSGVPVNVRADNVGTISCGRYGQYFNGVSYAELSGFSDSNASHGYYMEGGGNITFTSTSSEQNVGHAYKCANCQKVVALACNGSGIATQNGWDLDTIRQVILHAPQVSTITGYAVALSAGTTIDVVIIAPNFSGAVAGDYNASAITALGSGRLLVYRNQAWSALVQSVESNDKGARLFRGSISEEITLSTGGATTDSVGNLLPANSRILGVVAYITTTITTATDWKMGDATTAGRFTAANATLTAGTSDYGKVHMTTGIASATTGMWQTAAAKLRISTTGTPGAGKVRVVVFFETYTAPTS